jgi:CRP/FNR family transcriptional regulator
MNVDIRKTIPFLRPHLEHQINEIGQIIHVKKNNHILKEGQNINLIPIVIAGSIKVFSTYETKDLLLYYIRPGESCIMSFSAALNNEKSSIYAVTEEDSEILLLPTDKVILWAKEYKEFQTLFYNQFYKRYQDLLETINHLIHDKLDTRIYNYLKQKVVITGQNPIKISHRTIAGEVGTSREVVTRIIKKLENDNKVIQEGMTIVIK